ncbi:hypothetical protein [Salinibacillus kushneri]|nr:hypothetical protein [Salinibacillus kushneri]
MQKAEWGYVYVESVIIGCGIGYSSGGSANKVKIDNEKKDGSRGR